MPQGRRGRPGHSKVEWQSVAYFSRLKRLSLQQGQIEPVGWWSAVSTLIVAVTVLGWSLLGLLGLLLALLLGLLFVPVRYRAWLNADLEGDMLDESAWTGSAQWRVSLAWGRWLFGVRLEGEGLQGRVTEFWIAGLHRKPKSRSKERKQSRPKKARQRKARDRETLQAYVTEGFRLVRRLWPALRLEGRGAVRFGFPDPAMTGLAAGLLSTVRMPAGVRWQLDFVTPCLQGNVDLTGHIFGYEIGTGLLAFWWHLPARRRWRERLSRFWPGFSQQRMGG